MTASGPPGCQGSLQHSCPAGIRGAGTEGWWVQGQTHGLPVLGVGDTRMLAELGLTPHPKMWAQPGLRWTGTHRGSSTPRHRHWVCPVPTGRPRGAWTPPLTSWTRVVWQFLRSGPCSSTLGAPGGGRLTSQYACSWQSMTMRSPLRRCLAALPVQRQRGGAGTLPARHPGVLHPGRSPGRSGAGRARTHRSCSRACITTKSHVWLIRLCRRL